MLTSFDWLRKSRSGAELLATLKYLEVTPDFTFEEQEIGPPHSALNGPCERCWIYPRSASRHCKSCQAILAKAKRLGRTSRVSIVVWGFVNRLPRQLASGERFYRDHVLGFHVHGENRFLLMIHRRELKSWLQEIVLRHGSDLKGVIQILPTTGSGRTMGMGDILCRAIHHEALFSMDLLRVRFYSAAHQVLKPHVRDKQGMLNFEVSEFLSMLEMAAVFRTLLMPQEQKMLYELLNLEDASEERFYWGRLLGHLNQKAKDMLSAWRIRQWPKNQVKLLYELVDYVAFYQTD
jgi:hypothetical protein